jgi:hypothetical protein
MMRIFRPLSQALSPANSLKPVVADAMTVDLTGLSPSRRGERPPAAVYLVLTT